MTTEYSVPIHMGNDQIDRAPVDLSYDEVQELIDHSVRAIELGELVEFTTFLKEKKLVDPNKFLSFIIVTTEANGVTEVIPCSSNTSDKKFLETLETNVSNWDEHNQDDIEAILDNGYYETVGGTVVTNFWHLGQAMNKDDFLQNACMMLHDEWTQEGGDELCEEDLYQLNDLLTAFFVDKGSADFSDVSLTEAQKYLFEGELERANSYGHTVPVTLDHIVARLDSMKTDDIVCSIRAGNVYDEATVQEFVESIHDLIAKFNGNLLIEKLL